MTTSNARGWNKISESYQKRYNIDPSKYYWGPLCSYKLDILLGDIKNKEILELGSGASQNSIFLAKRGAIVTAFDISSAQLNYGLKLAKENNVEIKFVEGDFQKVKSYFKNSSFNKVVSSFALQYCTTIVLLESVMKQVFDLLKLDGELIFSVDHPIRHRGYWNTDDSFVLDDYFDRNLKSWEYTFPESGVSAKMVGSYITIGDYVESVIRAGFTLTDFIEPEPIKKEVTNNFAIRSRYLKNPEKNPFSYDHLKRIPGTLIIKATKK